MQPMMLALEMVQWMALMTVDAVDGDSLGLTFGSVDGELAEVLGTALGTVMGAEVIWMSTSGKNTPKSSATKEIFVSSGACNKEM
jgi:hypothetical protein